MIAGFEELLFKINGLEPLTIKIVREIFVELEEENIVLNEPKERYSSTTATQQDKTNVRQSRGLSWPTNHLPYLEFLYYSTSINVDSLFLNR